MQTFAMVFFIAGIALFAFCLIWLLWVSVSAYRTKDRFNFQLGLFVAVYDVICISAMAWYLTVIVSMK